MKKKVLAALLAVCMILSTCVLYASANEPATPTDTTTPSISFKKGDYVKLKTAGGDLKAGNLTSDAGKYDQKITIEKITPVELPIGTDKISDDQMDKVFKFTVGSTPKKWTELKKYFTTIENKIDGDTITVKFESNLDTNKVDDVYLVTKDITNAAENEDVKESLSQAECYYNINEPTQTNKVSKWTNNLYSFTTGVRFFGTAYDNLVASEIAEVKLFVKRKGTDKWVSSVVNTVPDLKVGDKVTVVTYLKNPGDAKFYKFNCWVSGDSIFDYGTTTTLDKLKATDGVKYECFMNMADREANVLVYDVKGKVDIRANYVEIADRHTITYSCGDGGKIVYAEGNDKSIENRDVFKGDGQVSVLHGKKAYFTFTPDDTYEVAHVYVDDKDVTSFLSLIDRDENQSLFDAIKVLIDGSTFDSVSTGAGNDNKTEAIKATGTYTFDKVLSDHTVLVKFQKKQALDAPSGLPLPTIAADGIVLETGADAENGDGENGATTVPAEDGAAANGGSAASGVVNPATGSTGAIAVFATLSVAACAAFVTAKKKED